MNELHDRILDISRRYGLSHIGSCLTAVDIIDEIYQLRNPDKDEPFVLSCGHCGLALYVILEKYWGANAEQLFEKYGTHPDRNTELDIHCSTGSLGHGLPIALGMALADRTKNVYCLISDGECFEGSVWESFNVMRRYNVTNLKVYLNYNGWSAYNNVETWMIDNITMLCPSINVRRTRVEDYGFKGLFAHYVTI